MSVSPGYSTYITDVLVNDQKKPITTDASCTILARITAVVYDAMAIRKQITGLKQRVFGCAAQAAERAGGA